MTAAYGSGEFTITTLNSTGIIVEKIPEILYINHYVDIATYINLTDFKHEILIFDGVLNNTALACKTM